MRRGWLLPIVLAAGCGDAAIRLRLALPDDPVDVSCVNQIAVFVTDDQFNTVSQCLTLDTPAPTLAAIQERMRDQFEFDLPEQGELLAVEVYGARSDTPDDCGTGRVMFYGGNNYADQDTIVIPVHGNVDCGVYSASSTRNVRVVDFRAVVETPPTLVPTCVEPAGVTQLYSGTLFASNLDPPDYSPTFVITWDVGNVVGGMASLPVINSTLGLTCPAIAHFDANDFLDSGSCVYPGAPTLCGLPGEVELPILGADVALASFDDSIGGERGMVLGAVWDAVAQQPITGATIRISRGEGTLVYGTWDGAAARFRSATASATLAGGMFALYAAEPVEIEVTSANHVGRRLVLGASWGASAAAIVALNPR